MPTVEELQQKISEETMLRVFGDNDIKNSLVNEQTTRNNGDDQVKIKIANESTDRASKDTIILEKISEEVTSRVETIEQLKGRLARLEAIVYNSTKTEPVEDKFMISQDMFVRQLNMLKRSAKFILDNVKVEEIIPKKEESKEFLRHLNNLQLTFDNLLTNQNKYTLTDETKKCIQEVKGVRLILEKLVNDNWDVERLFVDKRAEEERGGS